VTNPADATLTELAARIARRELTVESLVSAVLSRIDILEPRLNCFTTLRADEGMEAARAADREIARRGPRSPLHGIPIAVKDCLAVAGWPVTNGSLRWRQVPSFDAAVVERLRAAGAIVLGKNTMHEWAMGGTCIRTPNGPVRNPWDTDRIPGGSSGGSAAAVSAGLVVAAVGTDGMGSIRAPSAFCGVVGLKPTFGRISRYGDLPPSSSWVNHVGSITRTVADARVLLEVMSGADPRDPTSRTPEGRERATLPPVSAAALHVGRLRSPLDADTLPAVTAAVDAAATHLESLGATVEEVTVPSLGLAPLVTAGTGSETQATLLRLALEGPDTFLNPDIRYRILASEFIRAVDARRARQLASQIRADLDAALRRVDVLLLATIPVPAYPIAATSAVVGDGHVVDLLRPGGQARITTRLTFPFNVAGLPAVSVPAASLVDGMPVGIQLVAPAWADEWLLDVAALVESKGRPGGPPIQDPATLA
jgi:aspartyl-tRNA(Asn)/glutamyl-tRNA(Gln) amidotransferase subunit A